MQWEIIIRAVWQSPGFLCHCSANINTQSQGHHRSIIPFNIKSRPATGHLLAVLVADWFNLAIRHSGSRVRLNTESLKPCAEGSFQQKSFTNIWVCFFLSHQCYCALLLWVPLLQEIGGIKRLRFRDRKGRETLGCEVALRVLVFSNLETTESGKWLFDEVFWLQEKAGKR